MLQRHTATVINFQRGRSHFYKGEPLARNKIPWDQTMMPGEVLTDTPTFQPLNKQPSRGSFCCCLSTSKILTEHNQRRFGRDEISNLVHIIKLVRTDKQQCSTVQHGGLYSISCNGKEYAKEHVYNHVVVYQKLTQHTSKSTILHLKKNEERDITTNLQN